MSDDLLKRAEALRERNHPHNSDEAADQKARQTKFYNDNLPKVQSILVELGELWRAQDPNRPGVLSIGHHAGNDYYVYIDTTFENKIALYLFDKNNIGQKGFFTSISRHSGQKVPGESLRVEFDTDHFDLYLPFSETFPNPNWLSYSPKRINSLDDLKAVIAELWANGNIHISE